MGMEPQIEVILENKLIRVLLQYDMWKWKYPKSGVWSYLINTPKGITVFDTGPYYNTLFGNKGKLTDNSAKILVAIDKYFNAKPIHQIILSHYHHDHSQNAPNLQISNKNKYGVIAPIRIHENDHLNKKLLGVFNTSLNNIFKNAGYTEAALGTPLIDGEKLEGTDFEIIHLPGHTHGSVGLINHKDKIVICGWWDSKSPNIITQIAMKLINEDFENLKETKNKLNLSCYRFYYLHELN